MNEENHAIMNELMFHPSLISMFFCASFRDSVKRI